MIVVEKTGKTVEEAIDNALTELQVGRDRVRIDVLDEGSKGFLGLVGTKLARVKVTVKETKSEKAKKFLETMIDKVGVKALVKIDESGEMTVLDIVGDNIGVLIGRRGETLDAIQYLVNLVANKSKEESEADEERLRIIVDAEGYRRKREQTLRSLALRLAERVRREGRKAVLEPMNPLERRIIHTALQDNDYVSTHSEGQEPYRRIVISLK